MRKSKFKQTMSMLLAVLMVFMSMNFSVFAEELTAPTDETTTTTVEAPAEQPAEEQTPAVEAPAPVDEETGTTEENAVIQETPAMMALNDSEYLTPGTPALDEMTGKECFFANGTPITIEETTTEGKGAKITWDGGSQEVSSAANIFGGGHNHDGTYESTSVTMTGGTVNAVFGGGLHKSHVATANVVIKDGAVIGQIAGGAASSFSGTTCHQPWPGSDSPNAFVDTANATIEGGTIKGSALVYGGGEGMSQTGNTNLNITGGTFDKAYIIPGGSNGTTTGTAKVEISTDIKDSIVQGINRGKTENIVIDIKTGAKVNKVYAGGETGDSSVTGTIEKTTVNIAADSAVANLQPGTNGGIEIAPNSTELITLNYDDSAVINEGENTLEKLETRFGAAVLGKTTKAIAVADVEGKVISGYDDIQTAVDKAPSDSIIKLQKNIDVNQTIQYGNKNLTFDGNNKTYKLTSTAKDRIFMLTGTGDTGTGLTLINLEVIGNNTNQRGIHVGDITDTTDNNHYKSQITLDNAELKFDFCVDPRGINFGDGQHQGSVITLTNNSKILNGLNQEYENNWGNSGNGSRGLSLWNPEDVTVNIEKNSALKGFKYAVNVSGTQQVVGDKLLADAGGLNVTVDNSTIYGWAAFNIWASYGTYNVQNGSVLKGINTVKGTPGSANDFTTIKLNYDWPSGDTPAYQTYDNVLNITDSTITNSKTGDFDQDLLTIDNAETIKSVNLEGAHFVDATGTIDSAITVYDNGDKSGSISKAIAAVKAKTLMDAASTSVYQPAEGEAKSLPFYDIIAVNSEKEYQNLQEAIDDAADNDTITVKEGTHNLDQTLLISKPVTIKGEDNKTVVITRGDTWSPESSTEGSQGSLIHILNTNNVTLKNLTVTGARKVEGTTNANGHGINIVQSTDVTLKNITSKDNAAAGVVVNGSTVTATGLYTSGNGWYGVNVDQGSGVINDTQFALNAPYRFGETYQIVSDKYNSSDNIEVNLPDAFVQSDLENKSVYWNDSSTMIKNQNKNRTYPTIQAAIEDANRNNTILIPAGTYAEDLNITQSVILKKVEKAESDCVLDGNITVAEGKKVTLSDLNAGTNAAVMVKKGANLALVNSDAFVENQHITVEKLFGTEYDTSIIKQNDQEVAKDKLSFVYLGEEIKPDMNLFRANEVSYTIKTPAQFYWLSQQINEGDIDTSKVTIKLGNDLDFHNDEWLPVGVKGHDYVGSFDGQNYKISNLYVNKPGKNYTGLFGKAWGAKELGNVDFENVNITGGQYAGTLAGQLGSSTVKNVNVNNFVFKTGKFTGGIVGSGYSNISNCKVQSGSIATEDQNVGGILGFLGEGNFIIQNCHSDQITISEPSWDAGGLIGATVYGNVKVYNCSVKNSTITITASGWFESYGSYRGELIGEMRGSKTYEGNLYLYNCTSENTTAINKNVVGDQSQLVGGNQDYIKTLTVYNENNETPYATIQEAIDKANSGDTIKIGAGTYDEAITLTKAVNLIGPYADTEIKADEATMDNRPDESEAILTGGITINRTDTAENPSITISGLKFKTNGIQATGWGNNPKLENVTITDNVFDALRPSGNVAAIHFNLDAGTPAKNLTIDNNRITNVGDPVAVTPNPSGINTDVVEGKTNITNNYIDGTNHSSLQISGTAKGDVTITGNTFKNWDQNYEYDQLEKDGGGRAMRFGDFSGASLTVSQNKMVRAFEEQGLDKDQMVKFTKVPESGEFDLSLNYWNSKLPVTTYGKAKDSSVIVVSEGTAKINAVPYFTDEAMTNAVTPVQIEGSDVGYLNIQEAVNAAKADDTIILNADEYLLEAPVQIDKALTIKAGTNAAPWVKAAQNQNAFTVTGDVTGSLSFDGVNITAQTAPTGNESPKGIDVQQKAISGSLIYKNAEIKDMYYGILVSVNSSEAKAKIVNTLDINHAVFTDNLHKAVYVENANTVKVDSTTFTGDASTGTEYWPTRIALDINEKYNSYDSVSVTNCAFNNIQGTPGTPSQEGQVGYGAALAVKARNDGSYTDPAASLKNVTITGNNFTGNTCDLMIGEPAAEGNVAEHTWNLGTVTIQKNAFSSKVQNNYKQKTDTSHNYWGSETPDFTALTAGLIEVYPYYTDDGMTKLYAPIELRSSTAEEVKYFGTVKDAFAVANDSDTVVINQTFNGQPATIDEPIDMNVVSGGKLITVNLQLEGSTTFNQAFTGTTKGHMILSTGKNADQPTIAIFNGSVDGFVSVDAVNFDSAKAPVIKALSSETDPNSFISKTGVLSVSEEGDYRIWTYGSPSENFNGGDGSEAKPYQINTADQLKLLAKDGFNTKKYFKLTNDITVNDWTALEKFEGNFDGNGYSITGNSGSFIDALTEGAKVEKLRFEGFTNLVNTNNGTIENCYTVGEKTTAIVNIMGSGGTLTDSFTAGTKAVQTNEAGGTILRVYHCGEKGGIGTAMTKADMQKARFANTLNGNEEGIWSYDADVEAPSAYPYVLVDGKINKIEPIQISVSSIDETGKILTVDSVGEGPYYAKDIIKLKANVLDKDYLFNGWYQNEILISDYSQYEYTLRDQGPISIIAKYAAKPSIQFSVMNGAILGYGDGSGSVTINDADYNPVVFNGKATTGSSVTLKAKPELGSQFSYWRTMYDEKPISYDAEYTFNATAQENNMVFVAVFNKAATDVFDVTFMNQGIIYAKQKVKKDEKAKPVTNPTYIGKTFVGWVDEKGNNFDLTTPITQNTVLTAKYTDNKPVYTVAVEKGTITPNKDTYSLNENVTVTANTAADGEHFAGWMKRYTDGTISSIISYDSVYNFVVSESITLIATYSKDVVEEKPLASINQDSTQTKTLEAGENSLYTVKFIGGVKIPENYTGVATGLIYMVSNVDESLDIPADLDKNFIIGASGVITGSKMPMAPYDGMQFTKGKGSLKAGQTVAARIYLTCLNSQGEEVTFYSDVAQRTVTAEN